jgi:hypothetical protein
MRIIVRPLVILTLAMFLVAPLTAQHSFSTVYDSAQPLSVTGTIVNVDWVTPNVFIHVKVENKVTGRIEVWAFETAPPQGLMNGFGLTKEMFKEGQSITIAGFPCKQGVDLAGLVKNAELSARVRAETPAFAARLEFSDGRKFVVGSPEPLSTGK